VAETPAAPDERVLVVFDVNIYLDLARLLGDPFSWDAFEAALAIHATEPNPPPTDARIDSLRAIASLRSGQSPSGVRREVWTSDHINGTAAYKLHQSPQAADPRDRGLGWSVNSAQAFLDELVWGIVDQTDGDSVGEILDTFGSPPLDREDGRVLATARDAGFIEVDRYYRYVVTRDRGFASAEHLPGDAILLHPADWIDLDRGEQRAVAFKRLLGR